MINLSQLTPHIMSSLPTTWWSYCDHRLVWRHFTLCISGYMTAIRSQLRQRMMCSKVVRLGHGISRNCYLGHQKCIVYCFTLTKVRNSATTIYMQMSRYCCCITYGFWNTGCVFSIGSGIFIVFQRQALRKIYRLKSCPCNHPDVTPPPCYPKCDPCFAR